MKYYTSKNIDEYFKLFKYNEIKIVSKKKKKFYNIPCTFDIETTNAYKNLNTGEVLEAREVVKMKNDKDFKEEDYQKVSWMYVWMVSIDDNLFVGRTWLEFGEFMRKVCIKFQTDKKGLIFYIHNAQFEFDFIKFIFSWDKIFCSEPHKIMYATASCGITFKCSYMLSNSSLETVGKNLIKYKASKQVGKLDYNKIRHQNTPLTDDEIDYCLYDVIVLSNFIRESMEDEDNNSLVQIPLTKTGYVRRYCRNYVNNPMYQYVYNKFIHQFTLDEKLYVMLKDAFMGGFTHANALNCGEVFECVHSYDFTSSYPAVMLLEPEYPISKGSFYNPTSYEDFKTNIDLYFCIFDITFYNIRQKDAVFENIISESKCRDAIGLKANNGRVYEASEITITITNIDYKDINLFYNYDKIKINNFRRYRKGYLPEPLMECVLKFYKDKTTLKDVKGEEANYQLSKGMLNSIFGMMAEDPIKSIIEFNQEQDLWTSEINIEEGIKTYNNSRNRFLCYEHGLVITALARRNLFSGIRELGSDFIYADTDSLKFLNLEKHKAYFDNYNKSIYDKIEKVCKHYDFSIEDFSPRTIKGEVKTIGLWDYEGCYDRFKTLRAKTYLYQKDGVYNLTVSGLNKKVAMPYLEEKAKRLNMDVFDLFDDELFIDGEHSGKLLHTYLNINERIKVKDYLGNVSEVKVHDGIHLEPTPFTLSIPYLYLEYIKGVKTKYKKEL